MAGKKPSKETAAAAFADDEDKAFQTGLQDNELDQRRAEESGRNKRFCFGATVGVLLALSQFYMQWSFRASIAELKACPSAEQVVGVEDLPVSDS